MAMLSLEGPDMLSIIDFVPHHIDKILKFRKRNGRICHLEDLSGIEELQRATLDMIDYAIDDDNELGQLNCPVASDSGSLNALTTETKGTFGCECVSIRTDPGASGSVLPKFQCADLPIRRTNKSRNGYKYESA